MLNDVIFHTNINFFSQITFDVVLWSSRQFVYIEVYLNLQNRGIAEDSVKIFKWDPTVPILSYKIKVVFPWGQKGIAQLS